MLKFCNKASAVLHIVSLSYGTKLNVVFSHYAFWSILKRALGATWYYNEGRRKLKICEGRWRLSTNVVDIICPPPPSDWNRIIESAKMVVGKSTPPPFAPLIPTALRIAKIKKS